MRSKETLYDTNLAVRDLLVNRSVCVECLAVAGGMGDSAAISIINACVIVVFASRGDRMDMYYYTCSNVEI